MPDFTIRADSVDVEQIMRQIRGRIRDKRGVDYTEEQIRELAAAKLERFLDPTGVRSDLLEQFRTRPSLPPGFLYQFEATTLFDSDKAIVRFFRRLLHPFLKLLFNPNVLSSTLHKQAAFNQYVHAHQPLQFELLHNLVLELTRATIEVKNLRMRLESVQSRLEFNERRARALEAVVQYKPDAAAGGGRGGRDERREQRGEPRAHQPQGRTVQPPAQPRAPQQQQHQQQGRPAQLRVPPPQAEAATPADEPASPGTDPQGSIDPITGGDSLRTRRRRRRRGRRSAGEPGAGGDASTHAGPWGAASAALGPAAAGEEAWAATGEQPGPGHEPHPTGEPVSAEQDEGPWGTASVVQAPTPAGEDRRNAAAEQGAGQHRATTNETGTPDATYEAGPAYEADTVREEGSTHELPAAREGEAVPRSASPAAQGEQGETTQAAPSAVSGTTTGDKPQ